MDLAYEDHPHHWSSSVFWLQPDPVPDQPQHSLPLLPFFITHALATGSSGVIKAAGMLLVDQNYKRGGFNKNVLFSLENGAKLQSNIFWKAPRVNKYFNSFFKDLSI